MKNIKPSWVDTTEYPFASNYLAIKGIRMHYIDEGTGPVLLFVHGTPSWSFDFRKIIKDLSKDYRCIAMDHIGFGLSDKPKSYDYSTQKHVANLEFLVSHLGIKDFALIVHDFGGPIGLNLAIKNPDLLNSLIVFNSWLWSSEDEPEFVKLEKILKSPLLPFLYLYFNFSARFLLPGSFGKIRPSKKILAHYLKPFGSKNERYGTLGFARSLLNDQMWFEGLWNKVESISNKPSLFIWGLKDKFIGEKYLQKFRTKFTNSKALKLEEAGHFPQEEESEKAITEIRTLLEKNIKY